MKWTQIINEIFLQISAVYFTFYYPKYFNISSEHSCLNTESHFQSMNKYAEQFQPEHM